MTTPAPESSSRKPMAARWPARGCSWRHRWYREHTRPCGSGLEGESGRNYLRGCLQWHSPALAAHSSRRAQLGRGSQAASTRSSAPAGAGQAWSAPGESEIVRDGRLMQAAAPGFRPAAPGADPSDRQAVSRGIIAA
jgi:hypothetical protein